MRKSCEICGGTIFNEHSGECATCSVHNQYNFVKAWNTGSTTDNELSNKVLELLRSGKKWVVQKKRNSVCWHPGVKMTNGKCVFCSMSAADKETASSIDGAIECVQHDIEQLKSYLMVLQTYKALGAATVPERPQIKSPRQQAIAEGRKWYIPYEPCKHCHIVAERYVANGKCRNCGSK